MSEQTSAEIIELYRADPIVNRCLTMYRNGDVDYVEAMELAVVALSKRASELESIVIDQAQRHGFLVQLPAKGDKP